MQPEQNQKRNSRLAKIRQNLKTLPIVKTNTASIAQKIQKRNKKPDLYPQLGSNGEIQGQANHQQNQLIDLNKFQEKYQMLEKIGEGTNGVVRKCLQKSSEKIYAVKSMMIDEEQRSSLKENFNAMKLLDHPNIVGFRAIYLDYKKHAAYLVMDYEPSPNLKKIQKLTEDQLKIIMKQLLSTLQYVHSKKICHRDIKPENILYDYETKKIKLIDFGISKKVIVRNQRRDMLTITGALNYRAPEMFLGGGYDQRVDLWSAGVTFYKLATGKTPFQSEYVSTTIENILEGKIEFDINIWSFYSKFAKDLILRLLKRRQERLSAKQARNHFWFSKELEERENLLTQSDSLGFFRTLTDKKQQNKDDFLLNRSDTDGKSSENVQKIKSQLKSWLVMDNEKNSVVIEIDSEEEQTPQRKRRLNFQKEGQ